MAAGALPPAPEPRHVTVAAVQFACGADRAQNETRAEAAVRKAAAAGAQVVLLQELFSDRYFCQVQHEALFSLARERCGARARRERRTHPSAHTQRERTHAGEGEREVARPRNMHTPVPV